MYDERLAAAILSVLNSRYPDKFHLHELKEALPDFSSVSHQEWLRVIDALHSDGRVTGKFLRSGGNELEDAAMLQITPLGRDALASQARAEPDGIPTEAEQGRKWIEDLIRRLAGERSITVSEFAWSFDFDRRVHWLQAKFGNAESVWQFSDETLKDSVADRNVQRNLEKTLASFFIPDAPKPQPTTSLSKAERSLDDPYPTTLDQIEADIDYWVTRQGEGDPGSAYEMRVQQRLDHLRNLEQRYLRRRNEQTASVPNQQSVNAKEWDAFISHASEDKDFVEPLYHALTAEGLRVWYDKFELTVGDSLRASIDFGLAHSRYGVAVLSPQFFAKHWPTQELNGLAAREVDGTKVILPVWHRIDRDGIAAYSPMLADRVAVRSSDGLEAVVKQLLRAMQVKSSSAFEQPDSNEQ